MHIVPAVDIRGGLCVNLVQGEFDRETVFSDDPVRQAVAWREQGAGLVHVVDLDGARTGRCYVEPQLRAMTEAGVPFEVGGGVRDLDTVDRLIGLGARRVVLGTAAHDAPDLLEAAVARYAGAIAVGIDARDGRVALKGWADVTSTQAVDFARRVQASGAARIIYTDILSDGMMKGPNVSATQAIAEAVDIPVTASGGMSSLSDIEAVRALEAVGVDEVIIGRALYLGAFNLTEAMATAENR